MESSQAISQTQSPSQPAPLDPTTIPQSQFPAEKKSRISPLKILFILIMFIIFIGGVIFFFFPQIWLKVFLEVRIPRSKAPLIYTIPVDRTISSSGTVSPGNTQFSYYGVAFSTPWKDVVSQKQLEGATNIQFGNGSAIIVFDPAQAISSKDNFLEGKPSDVQKVKQMFGEQAFKSEYDFYNLILTTSPDQITFFTSGQEATAKSILMILKSLSTAATSVDKVYRFAVNNLRGFQFGDPESSKVVAILLFDNTDKQYSLFINGNKLMQEEIDYILSSLTPY